MPQHIIDKVHDLADAEDAPDLDEDGCPFFEWELGAPVNDDKAFPHAPPLHAEPDDVPDEDDGTNHDDDSDDAGDDDPDADAESVTSDDDESVLPNTDNDESISDDTAPAPQLNARSDNETGDDSSVEPVDELGSKITSENIVEGRRNRTATTQPNISSFGGKYHVNKVSCQHVKHRT
jgi:hypothetical protein